MKGDKRISKMFLISLPSHTMHTCIPEFLVLCRQSRVVVKTPNASSVVAARTNASSSTASQKPLQGHASFLPTLSAGASSAHSDSPDHFHGHDRPHHPGTCPQDRQAAPADHLLPLYDCHGHRSVPVDRPSHPDPNPLQSHGSAAAHTYHSSTAANPGSPLHACASSGDVSVSNHPSSPNRYTSHEAPSSPQAREPCSLPDRTSRDSLSALAVWLHHLLLTLLACSSFGGVSRMRRQKDRRTRILSRALVVGDRTTNGRTHILRAPTSPPLLMRRLRIPIIASISLIRIRCAQVGITVAVHAA